MTAQNRDDEIGKILKSDPNLARIAAAYMDENGPIEKALAQVLSSNSKEKNDVVRLFAIWLKLQEEEIRSMGQMLADVVVKLDLKSKKVRTRIESAEYLHLVKKSFRNWSTSLSDMKQNMIKNLLTSAATLRLSPDPILEIFIDWIDSYTDQHFQTIFALAAAKQPITRFEIWQVMNEHIPAEDSADADMYKLVIHDLTTGHIIRQVREKDYFGRFVRQTPAKRAPTTALAPVLTSAFDDTKPYELTELGKQLVRYIYTREI